MSDIPHSILSSDIPHSLSSSDIPHSLSSSDFDCVICMDTVKQSDIVYYNDAPNAPFKESTCCFDCVKTLIDEQWNRYYTLVTTDTCKKTVRSLIEKGPPQNVSDTTLFECNNPRKEVHEFKFQNNIIPASLTNAFTGEDREKWIKHLNTILESLDIEDKIGNLTLNTNTSATTTATS